jgi:hypothetical protein
MSDHDPYAPAVEEAKVFNEPVEAAPVDDEPAVEEAYTHDVPDGSAKEVLGWVGEDVDRAKAALSVEEEGQKRSTLITKLTAIID